MWRVVLLGVVAVEGEEEVEEEAAALETVSLCARRGSDTDATPRRVEELPATVLLLPTKRSLPVLPFAALGCGHLSSSALLGRTVVEKDPRMGEEEEEEEEEEGEGEEEEEEE